jgi:CheY-like chemotaxis protein
MVITNKNTILIAEDNKDTREMLSVFLQKQGFRVLQAKNGMEAVKIAQQEIPNLILMDLHMPQMDGITATRQIRSVPELSEIPILANSADGNQGIELFLNTDKLGKGFISYLTKPMSFDTLLEEINTALPCMV